MNELTLIASENQAAVFLIKGLKIQHPTKVGANILSPLIISDTHLKDSTLFSIFSKTWYCDAQLQVLRLTKEGFVPLHVLLDIYGEYAFSLGGMSYRFLEG
jgi:hypothetical protein